MFRGYAKDVPSGFQPSPGPFSRALTAEVRSAMRLRAVSGAELARGVGRSQSYLSKRLRDDSALTVDDVAMICDALDVNLEALLIAAVRASRFDLRRSQ